MILNGQAAVVTGGGSGLGVIGLNDASYAGTTLTNGSQVFSGPNNSNNQFGATVGLRHKF